MNTADLDMLMVVIRLGSFAAAAREMHVDPSSVSRTVAGLEEQLGTRLFQRNTRKLALTEAGEAFVERVGPLLDELQQVRHAAADAAARPRGMLRITASNAFGMRRVVPLLPAFCEKHPELKLDVVLTDAILDMLAERIDVAIRIGVLRDSTLIAVPLLRMRYRVVASPAWIESLSAPLVEPEDLARADCLAYSMRSFRESWLFQLDGGPLVPVAVNPRLLSANGLALRDLVLTGLGFALMPDWLVSDDLAAGRLVDLFPRHEVKVADAPTGVWMLYPSRSYVPAKVRAFIDFMRSAVRQPGAA
ncbi:MAG TPA: LysR family transcriptional regulator [Gammaproteobacteria bacterium]|jgi:DNA-binding transcriptional LysR family regulator|nr:LysR family transcriptional regulator [Gammaproteobacteria bacterium]